MKGRRDSPFFVHSLDGAVREDVPNHVGFERNYHNIDIPGLPTDHLEYVLREIEAPACELFKALASKPGRPFLTEAEVETAILFFAIQAARVPQSKRKYEKVIVGEGEEFMRRIAYSREFFDEVVTSAINNGVVEGPVDQEALRKAFESGDIRVVPDKTHVAFGTFRLASGIADIIEGRNCTLWHSSEPDWFVCSDYPVGLFYSLYGNALAPKLLPDVDTLYMPLAKNVALVIHQLDNIPTVQRAHQQMVAVVNAITVANAERFICSPTADFVCNLPNGQLGNATQTVQALRSLHLASENSKSLSPEEIKEPRDS